MKLTQSNVPLRVGQIAFITLFVGSLSANPSRLDTIKNASCMLAYGAMDYGKMGLDSIGSCAYKCTDAFNAVPTKYKVIGAGVVSVAAASGLAYKMLKVTPKVDAETQTAIAEVVVQAFEPDPADAPVIDEDAPIDPELDPVMVARARRVVQTQWQKAYAARLARRPKK